MITVLRHYANQSHGELYPIEIGRMNEQSRT